MTGQAHYRPAVLMMTSTLICRNSAQSTPEYDTSARQNAADYDTAERSATRTHQEGRGGQLFLGLKSHTIADHGAARKQERSHLAVAFRLGRTWHFAIPPWVRGVTRFGTAYR